MKSLNNIFYLIWILILFGCSQNNSVVNPPVIVNHPTFYIVNKAGRIVINATCPANEQMIGGGYKSPTFTLNRSHMTNPSDLTPKESFYGTNKFKPGATACDSNQYPLIIEASYPSSKNTWTVIIYNPDHGDNCYHNGDEIEVDCYAISNPTIHLEMKIDSTLPHVVNLTNAATFMTDTCNCPVGSVVTAGGFKLKPLNDQTWATSGYLSPVWGSYPYPDTKNHAMAWAVDYTTQSPFNAYLTTYVFCSTKPKIYIPIGPNNSTPTTYPNPLSDGPIKKQELARPSGAGYRSGQVVTDQGYFSSGGGYRTVYRSPGTVLAVYHGPINQNSADVLINGQSTPFSGWSWQGYANYQVDDQNATTETDTVYTLQIKNVPPNLYVKIDNPPDGTYINQDLNNKKFSTALTFTGEAYDHDGTAITGVNLKWEITGSSAGTGGSFTTTINLSAGQTVPGKNAVAYLVKLTATGKQGDQATASIYVYYVATIL